MQTASGAWPAGAGGRVDALVTTDGTLPAPSRPEMMGDVAWKPGEKGWPSEQLTAKVGLLPQLQSGGTTFTVTVTSDGGDANVGNGICADSNGDCTLRAAIEEADATTATDTIAFHIPGSGPHTIQPGSELPVINETVIIDGSTEPDFSGTPIIELDGTNAGAGAEGLDIDAANSIIRGLVINRFDDDGIDIDSGPTGILIQGNYIGTNITGTVALGNSNDGIDIDGSGSHTIGGTAADAGNVISGNGGHGIKLADDATDSNVIQGNLIGTDVNGTVDLGNSYKGIFIKNGDNNTIGGTATGAGNLISGNGHDGIELEAGASGNVVQGNKIGTDINGTADLGNGDRGIELDDAPDNTIGGTATGAGNLISGNSDDGIGLKDPTSTGNLIQGNYIGTNITGTAALGNSGDGIYVFDDAGDNTIGGTAAGAGNLISGNTDDGIDLDPGTTDMVIQGNKIGTNATATAALSNDDEGVTLGNADDNLIGGNSPAEGNTIAYQGAQGVYLDSSSTGNSIRANSIFSNTLLGIDLRPAGLTSNDSGDSDTGANNLQNYPVLSSATTNNTATTITGTLNSTANVTFTVDFYGNEVCDASGNGEGQYYLGSDTVVTDGSGDVSFVKVFPLGAVDNPILTATATDPDGNTSEFSACTTATLIPTAAFWATPDSGQLPHTVVFTNTSSYATSYLWDFGDGSSTSTATHVSHTYVQTGTFTATLTASNGGLSHVAQHVIVVTQPVPDEDDLVVTVTDISGSSTGISDTINLAVTLQNVSDIAMSGITLRTEGFTKFGLIEQSVGNLVANSSVNLNLPVTVLGYNTQYTATVIVGADADHLLHPVQDQVQITFASRPTETLTSSSQFSLVAGNSQTGASVTVEVLQEQLVPASSHLGPVIGFDLGTNSPVAVTHTIGVDLAEVLDPGQVQADEWELTYENQNGLTQTITNATYVDATTSLTFTALGQGSYAFSKIPPPTPGPVDGAEPEHWKPSFNEPVVSLFSGSATHNHPIPLPPGANGFQPTVGLTYNSSAGNGVRGRIVVGPAGFGWQLTSYIDVTQKLYTCQDGKKACYPNDKGDRIYHLTINGAGHKLVHANGGASNGMTGRYYAEGMANLFVYYCEGSSGITVCTEADDGDSNGSNGQADDSKQVSGGYWVVKTADNSTYRLGYTENSEQEILSGFRHTTINTPHSQGNPALSWRVDKAQDRFGNQILYSYVEYDVNKLKGYNPNGKTAIHAPASYIKEIEYGFGNDPATSSEGYLVKFVYNSMPEGVFGAISSIRTTSWEVAYLKQIEIHTRNGAPGQWLRRHELDIDVVWSHGQGTGMPQTAWCEDFDHGDNPGHMRRVPVLRHITEFDANGMPRVSGRADVRFDYEFMRTGSKEDIRFCYPLLTNMYALSAIGGVPIATFNYYPSDSPTFKYDGDDTNAARRNINVVEEKILNSSWEADAPLQHLYFAYDPNDQDFQGEENIFQGFNKASRCLGDTCASNNYETKETTTFLVYAHDDNQNREYLTGKVDLVQVAELIPDPAQPGTWMSHLLRTTDNDWGILNSTIKQPVLNWTITTDEVHHVSNRMVYAYDNYGNQTEVQEFGEDLSGTMPLRTTETEYLDKTTNGVWLVNLPHRVMVWDGLPDVDPIVSQQRMRYDGATCTTPNTLSEGLLTHVDIAIPGEGNDCSGDFLVTENEYGGGPNGGAGEDWQLTAVIPPSGPKTETYWSNLTQVGSTVQTDGTTSFTTSYVYGQNGNDPWLLTTITQPNGAVTTYDYDAFGRLTNVHTPNGTDGGATIHAQQYDYLEPASENAPISVQQISMPDDPSLHSVVRTFYDALGRPIQERSWGLSSDFNVVVTDIEYNDLGQTACQTAALEGGVQTMYSVGLDCETKDHSSSLYNPLGAVVASTGIDGLTDYGLTMGRTSISLNRGEQLNVATVDELGRLARVEEFPVTYDAFASGDFDLSPDNWIASGGIAPTNIILPDGESVVRLVGPAGGNGWNGKIVRKDFNLNLAGGGQGALFRFQLKDNHHGGRIGLFIDDIFPNDTSRRFIGFILFQNDIYPDYNIGAGDVTYWHPSDAIAQTADVWYRAQVSIDQEGRLFWRLWREDAPDDLSQQINVTYDDPDVMSKFVGQELRGEIHTGSFSTPPTTEDSIMYLADYTEGPVYTTDYAYDLQDNLTTVTDTLGYTTVITYDTLSRKRGMNDPDMGVWDYDYDASGNLIRQTDGNGDKLCFYYDGFNRLTEKSHEGMGTGDCPPSHTPANTLAEYTYHDSGPGLGQLETLSGNSGTVGAYSDSFSYDFRGRVTQQTRTINGRTYDMTVDSYDDLDRPLQATYDYPDGTSETISTGYDRQFEESLTIQGTPNIPLVESLTYNFRGQLEQLNRPGTVPDTSYSYYLAEDDSETEGAGDSSYRLRQANTPGLLNFFYTYDVIGNISKMEENVYLDWQAFSYDHLNRLVTGYGANPVFGCPETVPCYSHVYEYDGIGNIDSISREGVLYDYVTDSNQPHAVDSISGPTSQSFTYDANGNMTVRNDEGGSYTQLFDVENRLEQVTDTGSSGVTKFFYDANGQRLLTIEPDGTEIYYPFPGYEEEVDTVALPGQFDIALEWLEEGGQANARFGYAATTAGDINSDGYDDIIVGAHSYDSTGTDEGRATVYYGSASGPSSNPDWTVDGPNNGARLGFAVNTAGDVNNDGYADVIIGARYDSTAGVNYAGEARVYHGSASGLSQTADWTKIGDQLDSRFGHAVAAAGDVNGDGYDDVIISAAYYENTGPDQGRVFVYHGSATGLSLTANWSYSSTIDNEWFGYSVNSAGDVNSDGYDDVVVGSSSGDRVMVFHGSASGLSQAPDWTFSSGQNGSGLGTGTSVSGVGDVNQDGYDDVLVGGQTYTSPYPREGKIWLFYGSSTGLNAAAAWTSESNQANTAYGWTVAGLGDVNKDGYDDFIVGGDEYDSSLNNVGKIYLFLGGASGPAPTADWTAEGTQFNGRFGHVVNGAGDVDGNGWLDIIIGAQRETHKPSSPQEGQAYVYTTSPAQAGFVIQRRTYFLAGQAIATRISGDPDANRNGLFFMHSDHLGSASVMSYGYNDNGTAHPQQGQAVPGSTARYLPFGDWRWEPTADLTDIGFTGHKSNNVGNNDIGLIYMNARYYVPNTNRMASPDTIVPDPTNPQSYNRYSYVNNNPLRLIDPSGHSCQDALDGYPAEEFDCLEDAYNLQGEWPYNEENPLESLIGTGFVGAGTQELSAAMFLLFHDPSKKNVENALIVIAFQRGLDLDDVKEQYLTYYALTLQADVIGRRNGKDPVPSAKDLEWWGTIENLRFGKIIGDAYGIDAVFGALLSPTGGRIGSGDSQFLHWDFRNDEAMGYHGQAHDAGGYLYNYHGIGPGYTYARLDAPVSHRGNALKGHKSGIQFWQLAVDQANEEE